MAQRDRREYFAQYYQAHKDQKRAHEIKRVPRDRREYHKQQYQNNATYYKESVRRREREITEFIRQQKVGLSCKCCGNSDTRVLDFHHLDKDAKEISLSRAAAKGWSKDRILREIAKCAVLCANCHRIAHWEEWDKG